MLKGLLIFFLVIVGPSIAFGACKILTSSGELATNLNDGFFLVVQSQDQCPQNAQELKKVFSQDSLTTRPAMVANRGRTNPAFGSFSFFEVIEGQTPAVPQTIRKGDVFFGHFTTLKSKGVSLDQAPSNGKLMVELIAWDYQKGFYNFYELIGQGLTAQWFYRGDSKDAFLDNSQLKRQAQPNKPVFGRRMRCSGCHTSGGPIMKELTAPHNDWWASTRTLPFAPNQPSLELSNWMSNIMEASEFAEAVKLGIDRLEASRLREQLSFQERLRPLFCTTEINIVSAKLPDNQSEEFIQVSSHYFVNPLLIESTINIPRAHYLKALNDHNIRFPENKAPDADHPWLAPVKGYSDQAAISQLILSGTIDQDFASAVLGVDLENPLFSKERCGLLKHVPAPTPDWQEVLKERLEKDKSTPALELLISLLGEGMFGEESHRKRAAKFLKEIQQAALNPLQFEKLFKQLQERRQAVFNDEISKNPLGQILEPGFRVIFPVSEK